MGSASYAQHSFLGGVWSQYMQGRADRQDYRTAMKVCLNGFPVEEGAWTRRPGTIQLGTTRNGVAGAIRSFYFNQALPYLMEFTPGWLRFHQGNIIATGGTINVASITGGSGSPISVTTSTPHGLTSGNQVVFTLITQVGAFSNISALLQKQFVVTVVDSTHFTALDAVLGTFTHAVTQGSNVIYVARIIEFASPWSTNLSQIRVVQNDQYAVVLAPNVQPQVVTPVTPPIGSTVATFTLAAATFLDGPYLDPPSDGTTVTVVSGGAGLTPVIQVSSITGVNGGAGFQTGDVGRHMRLFSQPPAWSVATAYTVGATVYYGGSPFTCVVANTGAQPDISPTDWAINPEGAQWTWGTITAINSTTSVTLSLAASSNDIAGNPQAGGALLYAAGTVITWSLGTYSNYAGWPSVGTYHEGRLWLANCPSHANGFDASESNQLFRFSPTDLYGTVNDNNGISETLNASEVNAIYWMIPDHQGIVVGTMAGEWSIQASSLSDPLTPTSIQAHKNTKFGCENIEPRRTGMSLCFVRRYGRKLTEYISDVYSGKYSGTNLSVTAAHLMAPGIAEIGYQMETSPIIWCRMNNNTVVALTYRRDSPFGTQPASFAGWHTHSLGTNRAILSLAVGPSVGGAFDAPSFVTQDPVTNICYIETMTPVFLETDVITDAWFVDGAVNPAGADLVTLGGLEYVQFYGLDYIIGQTITVWGAGLDLGDYVVSSTGTIDVPINQGGSLTTDYLLSLAGTNPRYPVTISPNGGQIVYTMSAHENFDATRVSQWTSSSVPVGTFTDQMYVGYSFDNVRRNLMYTAVQSPAYPNTQYNTTGYTLWDGTNSYAPNAAIPSKSFWVGAHNLDTDATTWYSAFSATNVVPAGIGGGTGSWRRLLWAAGPPGNVNRLTDPWTGNLWFASQAGPNYAAPGSAGQEPYGGLYVLRLADQYQQIISPLLSSYAP